MTKQQITIEVDVPDGCEAAVLQTDVTAKVKDGERLAVYVEHRPAWQFPTWTTANWLAMDANGCWSLFENEPCIEDDAKYWWTDEGDYLEINSIVDFTPPPCTDWRQSKRRRPGS